jgi:hypothetical protein
MKLKKFLENKHLLMNEAESEDYAGQTPPTQSSYSDDMASILEDEEVDVNEPGEVELEAKEGDDEAKDLNAADKVNDDLISKFMEDEADEGQSDDSENGEVNENESSAWLDDVNKMDLTHDGKTFEVQSQEHAKELMQKGYDYTVKTQSLADERKAWEGERETLSKQFETQETELAQKYEEFSGQLRENQIIETVISQMQNEDPDLVAEISQRYQAIESQFNNPVYNSQIEQMNKQITELRSGQEVERASLASKEFDLEMQGSQNLVDQLKDTLGLEVDREVVQKRWLKGDDVKKAIFAEYGDRILKLKESKTKVAKTKRAVGKKQVTGGARSRTSIQPTNKVDYSKSYLDIVQDLGAMLD